MTLIRALGRIGCKGQVAIPKHVRIALGLKENDIIEIKVVGAGKKNILLSKSHVTRQR